MGTDKKKLAPDDFAKEAEALGRCFAAYSIKFMRGVTSAMQGKELNSAQQIRAKNTAEHAIPYLFAAFYQNWLDNHDAYGIAIDQQAAVEWNKCEECWCNICAKLETCTNYKKSDGITPPPCAVCNGHKSEYGEIRNGYMPRDVFPPCGQFEPRDRERRNNRP